MTHTPNERSWTLDDLPIGDTSGISICVIGAGFVGLVTAAGLARLGHHVTCIDINELRIIGLKKGTVDFQERNLSALVQWGLQRNRLTFDTRMSQHVPDQRAIFIAVGTAADNYAHTDLAAVKAVIDALAPELTADQMIVVRSTVPVGTAREIRKRLTQHDARFEQIDIISNPEFLREGNALFDFFFPHRIVAGADGDAARNFIKTLQSDRLIPVPPYVGTNNETAELIKYAANSFLATKLSFVNELAALCERTGADVTTVTRAMGLDPRIRPNHLTPGPGFGGSCLPKDLDEYIALGRALDVTMNVAQGAQDTNRTRADRIVETINEIFGELVGVSIGVLGLSYKAHTDDLRASPALAVIERLIKCGAVLRAYDPAANEKARQLLDDVTVCDSPIEAARGTNLLIIMTEWPDFKSLPWPDIKSVMASPNVFDTRNILSAGAMRNCGFQYRSIGRPAEIPTHSPSS